MTRPERPRPERLGDQPIEPAMHETANRIGRVIGDALKAQTHGEWGFCLMIFPFKDFDGRANYISNARREDVVTLLREQLRRFEGAPDAEGRA